MARFEIYRSGIIRREWRWRYRAANGRIIFVSSEGYRDRRDLDRSITIAQRSGGAPIVGG